MSYYLQLQHAVRAQGEHTVWCQFPTLIINLMEGNTATKWVHVLMLSRVINRVPKGNRPFKEDQAVQMCYLNVTKIIIHSNNSCVFTIPP